MDETGRVTPAASSDAGGATPVADGADRDSGWWVAFVTWTTLAARSRSPRWPAIPPAGPRLRLASLVAGALSVVMILGSIAFSVLDVMPRGPSQPRSVPSDPPSREQVAGEIATEADELGRSDPLAVLQLRIAAYTVDPGSARNRAALAQLLLGPRPLRSLDSAVGDVTNLAFDSGERLAVGGHDGVQEATGTPASMDLDQPLATNFAGISALAYGYGSNDLWVGTASGIQTPTATSTSGSAEIVHALARLGETGWAATTRDGRLVVWDGGSPSGAPDRVLADGLGSGTPLAATSDGRYLFTGSDGTVAVRDVLSGELVANATVAGAVTGVSIDADDRRLLVGHGDRASVFDITNARSPKAGPALAHPGGNVSALALAPDGQTAATAGGGITTVWELPESGEAAVLATLPVGGAAAIAYSADSAAVATATDSTVHLWSVAELLAYRPAQVQATVKLRSQLPAEPVTYAALNSDGSYLVTSGDPSKPGHVWSTRRAWSDEPALEHHATLDGPVRSVHALGEIHGTTMVTVGTDGQATHWLVTSPTILREGRLATSVDTAAVTPDGKHAVTVSGTEGTVWGLGLDRGATGTLSYPSPTTALAFASRGTALIGGHADGSVTTHTIDLRYEHADRRHLTSNNEDSPVDAVALSGNANVAMTIHENGAITVWDLTRTETDVGVSVPAAVGAGPHQAWLSLTGDFAVVSDTSGTTTLWSFVDRTAPALLATIIAGGATLPVAVSGDGSTALQINPDNRVVLWNLQPVLGLADNPTDRACELAKFTHERWREIVPDQNLNTPCLPPPVPDLDDPEPLGGSATRASPPRWSLGSGVKRCRRRHVHTAHS